MLPHALAGAGIVLVLSWLTGSLVPGAITASAFFLGRERRDFEVTHGLGARDWYRRWNILRWSTDNKRDLIPVSMLVWLVALTGSLPLLYSAIGIMAVLWLVLRPLSSGNEGAQD